ncbi:MAG TPA: YkgJ family cysteine cluster protein [Nitrososphaeraceae archaeon]
MLRKFSCVEGCSDCCIYRDYYPSVEYGKIGVLILPEEKPKIEALAVKTGVKIKIIPRIGLGKSKKRTNGPKKIVAYQMMGKNSDGNMCPFLDVENMDRSPHGGFKCRIYEERPLACRAYPVIEENSGNSVVLDNKCTFCCKHSTTNAERNGLQREAEALTKIKTGTYVDDEAKVWRYATTIGDEENKTKLLPEGWVLQNI